MTASSLERALRARRRVMTGATGFVGSHFALRLLRAKSGPLTLTRAESHDVARERVSQAVGNAALALAEDGIDAEELPLALAADLTRPSAGLDEVALGWLRHAAPQEFWHFAASLRYEDRHRAEIFASNLDGTRVALELARALDCDTFVYVSTAYTAGRRSGTIPEELPGFDAGFNNAYEESKAHAEHAVAEFCARAGLRRVILRPSIVIGPYATKGTGGSNTGLYGFLREVQRAANALRAFARPIELAGDPDTACNLVPVDWFVDEVCALIESGFDADRVYHNTSDSPLSIAEVGRVVAEVMGVPGFSLEPRSGRRSALEEQIARRTAFYGSYLSHDKSFARARPAARALDAADLADYVRGFLRELRLPEARADTALTG